MRAVDADRRRRGADGARADLLGLIPHADGVGIVTDQDLRSRVVAARRDPEDPVSEVMTSTVRTIPGSAMLGEAILVMLEGGFHHVPVTDGAGDLIGVVTDDLIGIGRNSPFLLKRAIEDAGDPATAIAVVAELPAWSRRWCGRVSIRWTSGTRWR